LKSGLAAASGEPRDTRERQRERRGLGHVVGGVEEIDREQRPRRRRRQAAGWCAPQPITR